MSVRVIEDTTSQASPASWEFIVAKRTIAAATTKNDTPQSFWTDDHCRESIDIHLGTRDGHLDGSYLLFVEMTVEQGCEGGSGRGRRGSL